ncbi:hypothetical protein Tco_0927092 [Tanacetum coccineum]|uniref:Uncharacterized protein n=1 Tax=Tanacetum coccineum TaxID=301880 RepID=A0ABQ5DEE8_9ASTR
MTLKLTHEKEPSEATNTSQSVSSGHVPIPQDTEGNKQPVVTRPRNSPPKDDTRKSKILHEGQNTDPQDSKGNKHPTDMGLLSPLDEGIHNLQFLPEGNRPDARDSEGNLHPADTGSPATHPDEGKTSYEVEPDIIAFIQSLEGYELLMEDSEDDFKEISDEEMYEVIPSEEQPHHEESSYLDSQQEEPHSTKHISPTPGDSQPESSKLVKKKKAKKSKESYTSPGPSDSKSSSASLSFKPYDNYMPVVGDNWEKHEEAVASYADLKWELEDFHETTINKILTNLKEVHDVVKDDPELNKKVLVATEAYTKNSSNLTKLLTLVKELDLPSINSTIKSIQAAVTAQNDHLAKWVESSASLACNVGPRLTKIENTQAVIQSDMATLRTDTIDIKAMFMQLLGLGENSKHIVHDSPFCPSPEKPSERPDEEAKKTPSQPKGGQEEIVTQADPIQTVIATTTIPEAQVTESTTQPITTVSTPIIEECGSSQITLRVEKGKGIATKDDPSPPKLVKILKEVRMDPDGLKEAELSKPEIMKVVVEVVNEAEVLIKGNKDFLKHQYAHLKLLTPKKKKRKTMELEPETYIIGLHCNKKLPEGVPFKKNLMIEEPEHRLFFIDAFGEPAFQMIIGIHKVETKTLLGYKL